MASDRLLLSYCSLLLQTGPSFSRMVEDALSDRKVTPVPLLKPESADYLSPYGTE